MAKGDGSRGPHCGRPSQHPWTSVGDPCHPAAPSDARLRAEDPALSTVMRQAIDQSATFRGLVEAIQATDGIVYVTRGRCGHYVRACLLHWMAAAGPNRMVRVVVDSGRQTDIETMASLGHELTHALEVLAEPSVRTGAECFNCTEARYKVYSRPRQQSRQARRCTSN
jgi:hypothetical protein